MNKVLWWCIFCLGIISPVVHSQDFLSVQGAKITALKVYEKQDNSTVVWIYVNGNSKIGPNPANTSTQCELWTTTDAVYTVALSAFVTGSKVDIQYVDRGEGTHWCNVRTLMISSD